MNQSYYEIESNFTPVYQTALALMRGRGHSEICSIATTAKMSVINSEYDNWNGGTYGYTVYLSLSVKKYSSLSPERVKDIEKIFSDSLNEAIKGDELNYFMVQISPLFSKADIDWDSIGGQVGKAALKSDIETIKKIMVSVSTGKSQIQDEDDRYKAINSKIKQSCQTISIAYNNNYSGLWDWYGKWKADLPTYQSRRLFVNDLFAPILTYFEDVMATPNNDTLVQLDDWERINRTIVKIKKDSGQASNEEDFQAVGLLCREVIISLAQAVYDPLLHGATDDKGVVISNTDAFRMISNYISTKLSGSSNEQIRAYSKKTNDLANYLTHKRTACKRDMLLSTSATIALINFIGIIEEKYI